LCLKHLDFLTVFAGGVAAGRLRRQERLGGPGCAMVIRRGRPLTAGRAGSPSGCPGAAGHAAPGAPGTARPDQEAVIRPGAPIYDGEPPAQLNPHHARGVGFNVSTTCWPT